MWVKGIGTKRSWFPHSSSSCSGQEEGQSATKASLVTDQPWQPLLLPDRPMAGLQSSRARDLNQTAIWSLLPSQISGWASCRLSDELLSFSMRLLLLRLLYAEVKGAGQTWGGGM